MTPPRRRRLRRLAAESSGFTLIEVMVAALVLASALVALFGLLDASVKASANTRSREGATNLAREILEDARTQPYAQMSPTSTPEYLKAMKGLESTTEVGWHVLRRATTYSISVTECSIDDPKNGLGVHDSTFCKDPGEKEENPGTDPQPANLKRVTVVVSWEELKRKPSVTETLTLSAAGAALGLSASELKLSSPKVGAPTAPVITTEPGTKELTFTVKVPTGTEAVDWAVNGVHKTPAATKVTTTEWTFSWSIAGISDGTYKVEAQAVNAEGVEGPPVAISVILIRNVPAAPGGLIAGFNNIFVEGVEKRVVELQWNANSELNVIGYRVWDPSSKLVCPETEATLSRAVTCIDFNPPSAKVSSTFKGVALYRKAEGEALSSGISEGTAASVTVGPEPLPAAPNVPTGLELAHGAEGAVTLKWTAPKGGTAVSFYRIYRGSKNYTSRYGTQPSESTSFTDSEQTEEHSYWVTAVASNLTESAFLGPVKG